VCEIAHAKLFDAIRPADDLGEALGNEGGLEQPKVFDGPGRIRTCDLGIKSPLLYQLSYRPAGLLERF
jgi:hypothetical protein